MKRMLRDVERVVRETLEEHKIKEFKFIKGKSGGHPKVTFFYNGAWHSIPFSSSSRPGNCPKYVRAQVCRTIRGASSGI